MFFHEILIVYTCSDNLNTCSHNFGIHIIIILLWSKLNRPQVEFPNEAIQKGITLQNTCMCTLMCTSSVSHALISKLVTELVSEDSGKLFCGSNSHSQSWINNNTSCYLEHLIQSLVNWLRLLLYFVWGGSGSFRGEKGWDWSHFIFAAPACAVICCGMAFCNISS